MILWHCWSEIEQMLTKLAIKTYKGMKKLICAKEFECAGYGYTVEVGNQNLITGALLDSLLSHCTKNKLGIAWLQFFSQLATKIVE